jgi:hypothetical protein
MGRTASAVGEERGFSKFTVVPKQEKENSQIDHHILRGLDIVNRAILIDSKGGHLQALALYRTALKMFNKGIQGKNHFPIISDNLQKLATQDSSQKHYYRSQIEKYVNRVKELESQVQRKPEEEEEEDEFEPSMGETLKFLFIFLKHMMMLNFSLISKKYVMVLLSSQN